MSRRISPENLALKDADETVERIVRFLRDYRDKTGASLLILGMSGGVDSSVAAALSAMAVGGKRVLGVYMPENETRTSEALSDAKAVAEKTRIGFRSIDITELANTA